MSKKNRNKNRAQEDKAVSASTSASAASKPKDEKDADLRREFKNLAVTILFILLLLTALYYLDQKDQILDKWTTWIFGLF